MYRPAERRREAWLKQAAAVAPGLGLVLLAAWFQARPVSVAQESRPDPDGRFEAIDLFIDTGGEKLAAYQLELVDATRSSLIAGIEGGDHAAFKDPAYYDPAALHKENRVILLAFNTGTDLPRGKTRVATVTVLVRGGAEPDYTVKLEVAAGADGSRIPATATLARKERK